MSEITNLIKNGKETYSVFLDGCFFCKLNAETIVKNGIKIGKEISKQEIENAQAENEKLVAFDKCLKLLSIPKTEKQVKDYLFGKGYTKKTVDYCIEKLNEYNYLNDEAFANLYVKSYSLKKGKRLLEFELKSKGVSQEIINNVLANYESKEEDLLFLAEKFIKNKEKNKKTAQKLTAHLFSKGFGLDEINPVVKKLIFDLEEQNEDWDWHFGNWKN